MRQAPAQSGPTPFDDDDDSEERGPSRTRGRSSQDRDQPGEDPRRQASGHEAPYRVDRDSENRASTNRSSQSRGPRGRAHGRAQDRGREDRGSIFRWSSLRWQAFLLRTRSGRILLGIACIAVGTLLFLGYRTVRGFLEQDARFRINSSSSIQIAGASEAGLGELTRPELLGVFGGDIGRNIFFVPLAKRQAELERVPWVAHATVMRLLPDQLRVAVVERVPVAFVRLGNTVELVDAEGVLLHLPPSALAAHHYSFPVITGMAATDTPASRAARMHLYQRFVRELDGKLAPGEEGTPASAKDVSAPGDALSSTSPASGPEDASTGDGNLDPALGAAHPEAGSPASVPVSSQLSEVDLTDLEDVKAVVPAEGNDILLHFGDSDFLARYRSYQAHLPEWRQQYPHLKAVDLRYDRQVVLKMADGAESEASSVDHGNSLTAAPPLAPAANAGHGASSTLRSGHGARPASHSPGQRTGHAGHGTAHGWRPR